MGKKIKESLKTGLSKVNKFKNLASIFREFIIVLGIVQFYPVGLLYNILIFHKEGISIVLIPFLGILFELKILGCVSISIFLLILFGLIIERIFLSLKSIKNRFSFYKKIRTNPITIEVLAQLEFSNYIDYVDYVINALAVTDSSGSKIIYVCPYVEETLEILSFFLNRKYKHDFFKVKYVRKSWDCGKNEIKYFDVEHNTKDIYGCFLNREQMKFDI